MTMENISPIKKTPTLDDFKNKISLNQIYIKAEPIKENHKKTIDAINSGKLTIISGCAGTGKTFMALNLGIQKVLNKEFDKVVIFRNTVSVRHSGFLPGTEEDKNAPFEAPYKSILQETFNCYHHEFYPLLKSKGLIDFRSTAFNQGVTLDRCFIILDEAQNLNYEEIYNVFTRAGNGTVIHFCGDYKKQTFLRNEKSGFEKLINIIKSDEDLLSEFEIINMTTDDIVRSKLVKKFIIADYNYLEQF